MYKRNIVLILANILCHKLRPKLILFGTVIISYLFNISFQRDTSIVYHLVKFSFKVQGCLKTLRDTSGVINIIETQINVFYLYTHLG